MLIGNAFEPLNRFNRWSTLSQFMRLRVSQASAAIPLIGYALLWSEQLSQMLALGHGLGDGIWTDTTGRLKLLYYGAIVLTVVWALYVWRCPNDIRRNPTPEQFLSEQMTNQDELAYRRAADAVGKSVRKVLNSREYIDTVPLSLSREIPVDAVVGAQLTPGDTRSQSTILRAYYLLQDGSEPRWSGAALVLAAIGLALVLTPSLEVFLLVTWKVLL